MAKLPRTTQKIFAKNAPANQITTFGSIKAGTPVYSTSASDIMNANFEGGWSDAVEDDYAPYRQDRNAVDTAVTQQLAYLYQEGIPEWDSGTTYYKGSIVKYNDGNNSKIYKAIYDNTTAALTNTSRWQLVFTVDNSGQMGDVKLSGTPTAPTATSGTSTTQIATTEFVSTALSGKANDSDVVKLTGNQSIAGTKTFSTNIIRTTSSQTAGLSVGHQYTNVTKGIAPAATVDSRWRLFDKDGTSNTNALGGVSFYYRTNGATISELIAFKPEASSSTNATISITYPASGDPFTSAPTPATADNSTKIATTAYVQSNLSSYALDSSVVKLTGDQTIAGAKTFTSYPVSKISIDLTDLSSNQEVSYFESQDTNGTAMTRLRNWVGANGAVQTRIRTLNGLYWADLNPQITSDGKYTIQTSASSNTTNNIVSGATNSTSSTELCSKGWVNNPSTSTNIVHRTGNETIGGQKTFSDGVVVSKTGNEAFVHQNSNIVKGTAPSSSIMSRWRLCTTGGVTNAYAIGGIEINYSTSGTTGAYLQAFKPEASATTNATLGIYYPASGDPYTSAPTPPAGDNSTKIATTAWVKTLSGTMMTSYVSGDSGYIIWDFGGDKYIEQWGHHTYSSTRFETVTLSQAYADNMYSVVGVQSGDASPLNDVKVGYSDNTTTTFKTKVSTSGTGLNWRTFGKAA